MISTIRSAFFIALSVLALAVFSAAAESPRRPNIIFIMADDLGWTDLGVQGSKYYETPNIDRLAAQGLRLTRYHHCQNCTPTRAALMSGQYSPRTGVYTVGGIGRFDWSARPLRPVDNVEKLPLDKITVAQSLKTAGYATGMFGKWHLGEGDGHHPAQRGFDEAIVSMGKHFDFATNPKTPYPPGTYLADFLTDQAEGFIRRHSRVERDSLPKAARRAGAEASGNDAPFFLYLTHFGVHSPHQAKKEWIEKFQSKPGVGGHNNPTYAAMIASVDESVGRVMALLDELKLADSTVLIFCSDNGGVGGYQREGLKGGGSVTDNAPLRSGKGSLYEGGTRVPFIVRWPGTIKPGATCDVPAIHVDMYPTFLELAAAKPPASYPLDGESLVPLWRDPAAVLKREAIYQHFPGYLGAGTDSWRTTPVGVIEAGDWKLMEFFEDGRLELYNLREDIGETRNLATELPDKAKALREKLAAWRAEVRAPMPAPNTEPGSASKPAKKKRKAAGAADL